MKTLAQRIEDAQNELVQLKDQLTDHLKAEDADEIVTGELANQIEAKEGQLGALKRAEAVLATKGATTQGTVTAPGVQTRRPLGVAAKEPEPRDLIVRAAVAHTIAHVTGKSIEHVLEQRYPDHEATAIVTKAAVAGATTTATGWAAELVNTATADFIEVLNPISVFPQLVNGGSRLVFNNQQGAIKIPSESATPSISGSFVGEGAPIPVRRMGVSSITLTPRKMGVISVFSREIAMYSTPAIEGLIRRRILADTAITLDTLLLDAVAGSAVRPAGLLNGVTPLTATAGGGHAAIIGDIAKLAAPFDTANAGRDLVLLMNRGEARRLAMTAGPDGTFGFTDRFLNEFRVIVSNNVPAGRLIMLDAADLATGAGDAPVFDISEQTVLHMEDTTPLQIGTTGAPATVAAPAQSMFQTAQIAVRMLLDVTWSMTRPGMVQTITGVTW